MLPGAKRTEYSRLFTCYKYPLGHDFNGEVENLFLTYILVENRISFILQNKYCCFGLFVTEYSSKDKNIGAIGFVQN